MARLRTLAVTTADGPQDILILDKLTAEQLQGASNVDPDVLKAAGIPPILAFDYEVDLPETEDADDGEDIDITTHADLANGYRVTLHVTEPEKLHGIRREMNRTAR